MTFIPSLTSCYLLSRGKDDLPLVVAMNPVTLHTNVLNGYSPRMTEYMSIGMLITANMISMAARFRSIQWYGVRI